MNAASSRITTLAVMPRRPATRAKGIQVRHMFTACARADIAVVVVVYRHGALLFADMDDDEEDHVPADLEQAAELKDHAADANANHPLGPDSTDAIFRDEVKQPFQLSDDAHHAAQQPEGGWLSHGRRRLPQQRARAAARRGRGHRRTGEHAGRRLVQGADSDRARHPAPARRERHRRGAAVARRDSTVAKRYPGRGQTDRRETLILESHQAYNLRTCTD